jgi:hypothetical protein
MRKLIKEADPDVVEEWKWMGTPIWSHAGIICNRDDQQSPDCVGAENLSAHERL